MLGSIKRLRRHVQVLCVAPVMLVGIGIPTHPDPIAKRVGGTAGVISIPATTAPAPVVSPRSELFSADARRDTRAARGRVLYAAGHAPRDTTTAIAHALKKPPCEERVVQGHGRNPSPTV